MKPVITFSAGTKRMMVIFAMLLRLSNMVFAQTTTPALATVLKGLRKETAEDSLPASMSLDGSVAVYDANGNKVTPMEMMKVLQSGNSFPVRYINDKKEVKAYVLRPTTDEEKKQIKGALGAAAENNNEMTGKPALLFTVKDMRGIIYSLPDLKGKIVVINFWFTECKPCIMEMPALNKLVEKYKNKHVVFLGIASSETIKILKFLKTHPYHYTIVPKEGGNTMVDDYKINSYPTHIIIDRESVVNYYTTGLSNNTVETLDKTIAGLLK
jgi:thiol-disulfide isomerase/thioredoxin